MIRELGIQCLYFMIILQEVGSFSSRRATNSWGHNKDYKYGSNVTLSMQHLSSFGVGFISFIHIPLFFEGGEDNFYLG